MAKTNPTLAVRDRRSQAPSSNLAQDLLDLSTPDTLRTEIIELSSAAKLHTELLEICARDLPPPDAPPPDAPSDTPPCERRVDTAVTAVLPAFSAYDPNLTIYDGGALREYARQLLEEEQRAAVARHPESISIAGPAESTGASTLSVRPRAAQARFSSAVAGKWRTAPLSRKLVLLLLPLSTFALLRPSGEPTRPNEPSARAKTALASALPASSGPAPLAKSLARTPVAPAVPASSALTASADGEQASPSSLAAASLNVELERQALRAAFAGNKLQAAAAYERLGEEPQGERFRLAARLLREDRVRKP